MSAARERIIAIHALASPVPSVKLLEEATA
ncbi:hypothetical protein ATK30_8100 [Amycolatopsis echigonensis]|uniref:Uncharacterized protein n=1 Tax=Amycolatopsis echigonensis TaxID=2576905 RepID=A0A2N3WTG0_9PSEU|nr:hypothetical protein ATK30_8100 [Amycolatopsis niigatensis]